MQKDLYSYIIVSDLHLGADINNRILVKLKSIFNRFDRIIINGDFFDDSKTNLDNFIASDWQELFFLLRRKKCIYIIGNHDFVNQENIKKCSIFSNLVLDKFEIKKHSVSYLVTHGHGFSHISLLAMKLNQFSPILIQIVGFPLGLLMKLIEFLVVSGRGNLLIWINRLLKKQKLNLFLITGHTHVPELDIANQYANSGFVADNYLSYIVIDSLGNIFLHEEKY